jgi:hypothetical protein
MNIYRFEIRIFRCPDNSHVDMRAGTTESAGKEEIRLLRLQYRVMVYISNRNKNLRSILMPMSSLKF